MSGDHVTGAPQSRRVIAVLLSISVVLNAGLIWSLCKPRRGQVPQAEAPASTAPDAPKRQPSRPTSSLAKKTSETASFRWSMLESPDARIYTARLRAAGVPEKIVRGLVVAQLYAQRQERLARIAGPPFWAAPAEVRAARVTAYRQRMEEIQRTDSLGRELVGAKWVEKPYNADDLPLVLSLVRFLVGPFPPDNVEDLLALLERGEFISNEFPELPLLAGYRERERLRGWWRAAVGEVLSPAQQQEFARRLVSFGFVMGGQEIQGFTFHAEELRGLAAMLGHDLDWGDLEKGLERKLRTTGKPALAKVLAPDRYQEVLRCMDDDYRAIRVQGDSEGDPGEPQEEKALQIYAIKKQAEVAWRSLHEDTTLDESTVRVKFQEVRRDCTDRTRKLLGFQELEKLRRRQPYWLLSREEER